MARLRTGLPALLLTTAAALSAAPAQAVVLDFAASTSLTTQDYGDIPGLLDVSHAYQFGASTGPLAWWDSGYDELRGVAWASQPAPGTVGRLSLTALDPTRPVQLNSFRLGSWEGAGSGRLETVTVTRIGDPSPAFSFTGVIGAGNLSSLFSPNLSSATGLVIAWSNPWWTAIDNVDIGVTSAVPEPGAGLLMPLGLLGLGLFLARRQRLATLDGDAA